MWNNQKQQKVVSLLSNLQTYCLFKLDFQKKWTNISHQPRSILPHHVSVQPALYLLNGDARHLGIVRTCLSYRPLHADGVCHNCSRHQHGDRDRWIWF